MATIKNGFLGNFVGKISDIEGFVSKGQGYIITQEEKEKYHFSFIQKTNQTKFGLTSSLLSSIYPYLKSIFYYKTTRGQSKFQLLNKLNKDLYGLDLIANPTELRITSGNLPHAQFEHIFYATNGIACAVKTKNDNEVSYLGGNRFFFPYMYRADLGVFFVPTFLSYTPSIGFVFRYPFVPANVPLYFYSASQLKSAKNSTNTFAYFTANSRGAFQFSY